MSNPTARRRFLLGSLAAGAVLLAACSSPKSDQSASPQSGGAQPPPATGGGTLTVAVVTHGGSGDAYWSVGKNGAEAAGKQLGVNVTYSADGDPGAQAKLIDNAVAQKVGGLVVSMANPDALKTSIEN